MQDRETFSPICLFLGFALAAGACNGDDAPSESGGTDGTTSSTTSGQATVGTSAGTAATEPETGTGGGSSCEFVCMKQVECDPGLQTYEQCVQLCDAFDDLYEQQLGADCLTAREEMANCWGEQTCEQWFAGEGCDEEEAAFVDRCMPAECNAMCAKVERCAAATNDCRIDCFQGLSGLSFRFGDTCWPPYLAWAQCLAELDCPALAECLDAGPNCPCQPEVDAVDSCD